MDQLTNASARGGMKHRPTPIDRIIGSHIRFGRTSVGISQTDLARAIGLTFQQVQKYESGANRVSASRLVDIAHALGLPISYFFENTGESVTTGKRANAMSNFLGAAGAVRLARAFADIPSAGIRGRLVDLASALAVERPQSDDGR